MGKTKTKSTNSVFRLKDINQLIAANIQQDFLQMLTSIESPQIVDLLQNMLRYSTAEEAKYLYNMVKEYYIKYSNLESLKIFNEIAKNSLIEHYCDALVQGASAQELLLLDSIDDFKLRQNASKIAKNINLKQKQDLSLSNLEKKELFVLYMQYFVPLMKLSEDQSPDPKLIKNILMNLWPLSAELVNKCPNLRKQYPAVMQEYVDLFELLTIYYCRALYTVDLEVVEMIKKYKDHNFLVKMPYRLDSIIGFLVKTGDFSLAADCIAKLDKLLNTPQNNTSKEISDLENSQIHEIKPLSDDEIQQLKTCNLFNQGLIFFNQSRYLEAIDWLYKAYKENKKKEDLEYAVKLYEAYVASLQYDKAKALIEELKQEQLLSNYLEEDWAQCIEFQRLLGRLMDFEEYVDDQEIENLKPFHRSGLLLTSLSAALAWEDSANVAKYKKLVNKYVISDGNVYRALSQQARFTIQLVVNSGDYLAIEKIIKAKSKLSQEDKAKLLYDFIAIFMCLEEYEDIQKYTQLARELTEDKNIINDPIKFQIEFQASLLARLKDYNKLAIQSEESPNDLEPAPESLDFSIDSTIEEQKVNDEFTGSILTIEDIEEYAGSLTPREIEAIYKAAKKKALDNMTGFNISREISGWYIAADLFVKKEDTVPLKFGDIDTNMYAIVDSKKVSEIDIWQKCLEKGITSRKYGQSGVKYEKAVNSTQSFHYALKPLKAHYGDIRVTNTKIAINKAEEVLIIFDKECNHQELKKLVLKPVEVISQDTNSYGTEYHHQEVSSMGGATDALGGYDKFNY